MERKFTPNLWICVVLDLLGCASYAVPLLGEVSDIVWAPIAAFLYYRMFGGTLGSFGSAFTFIEELFPGTDFIPTFTLSWIVRRVFAAMHQRETVAPR